MTKKSIQDLFIEMLDCLIETDEVKNLKTRVANATEESDWDELSKDVFDTIQKAVKNTFGNQ